MDLPKRGEEAIAQVTGSLKSLGHRLTPFIHLPSINARKAQTTRHINPHVRAYGKARLDVARRITSQEDWDLLWKEPANQFPFTWAESWRQCIEYRVEDYPAEVGFFVDILGLTVEMIGADYARFSSPDGLFSLAFAPGDPGQPAVSATGLRLQFHIAGLGSISEKFEKRGIPILDPLQPLSPGAGQFICSIQTPNGLVIDLIGELDPLDQAALKFPPEAKIDPATTSKSVLGEEKPRAGEVDESIIPDRSSTQESPIEAPKFNSSRITIKVNDQPPGEDAPSQRDLSQPGTDSTVQADPRSDSSARPLPTGNQLRATRPNNPRPRIRPRLNQPLIDNSTEENKEETNKPSDASANIQKAISADEVSQPGGTDHPIQYEPFRPSDHQDVDHQRKPKDSQPLLPGTTLPRPAYGLQNQEQTPSARQPSGKPKPVEDPIQKPVVQRPYVPAPKFPVKGSQPSINKKPDEDKQ